MSNWVYGVPSAVAWAVANAGRRVVPLHDGVETGDLLLIRSARPSARDASVLELVGYEPERLPRDEIVALAYVLSIVTTENEIPNGQRRWTSEPSVLLRDVEPIRPFEWPLGGAIRKRRAVPQLLEVVRSRRIKR